MQYWVKHISSNYKSQKKNVLNRRPNQQVNKSVYQQFTSSFSLLLHPKGARLALLSSVFLCPKRTWQVNSTFCLKTFFSWHIHCNPSPLCACNARNLETWSPSTDTLIFMSLWIAAKARMNNADGMNSRHWKYWCTWDNGAFLQGHSLDPHHW